MHVLEHQARLRVRHLLARGQVVDDELAQRVGVGHLDVGQHVVRAAEQVDVAHLGAGGQLAGEPAEAGTGLAR